MTPTNKKYTVDRIKSVMRDRLTSCACAEPDLADYIRGAIVEGKAIFRPLKEVIATARANILHSYHNNDIYYTKLFIHPASYKTAVKKHADAEAKVKKGNDKLIKKFNVLIDQVNLGEFEDGKEAIAESHTI